MPVTVVHLGRDGGREGGRGHQSAEMKWLCDGSRGGRKRQTVQRLFGGQDGGGGWRGSRKKGPHTLISSEYIVVAVQNEDL